MGRILLQVGNLPSNRLALTNKVYISPSIYSYLVEALGPESASGGPLVTVGPHVYIAEGNAAVPDDKIALNGLQRRFAQLSLANKVEVRPFHPPANYALAAMEIEVDLLQKKSVSGGAPREIDTDRLASDFLLNYEGHVFEIGQTVAMDFEGTKFELRVNSVSQIDLSGKKPSEELVRSDDATRVGQLLAPTALTFARPQGECAFQYSIHPVVLLQSPPLFHPQVQ